MRRKILQDHANTFCQMLVGWRMGDDLEVLAGLPDGVLSVDILAGRADHSAIGPLQLGIAEELQVWFSHRLEISGIPKAEIHAAGLSAVISTGRIATNRKSVVSFDFSVESRIETSDARYVGQLKEVHQWHARVPSNRSSLPTRNGSA